MWNRNRTNRMVKLMFLIVLLCLPMLVVIAHMKNGKDSVQSKPIPHWEYSYEEGGPWKAIDNPRNPPGRGGSHLLWLKAELPEGSWRDPALAVQMYHRFEMYTEQGVIYRFDDMSENAPSIYKGNPPRIVPIPEELVGHTVYFRVFSEERYIGLLSEAYVDSRADIVLHWFRNDTDQAVIGFFYILFALVGGYLYWINRSQTYFLAFTLFTLLLGLNTISRLNIIYLYYDNPLFWKVVELVSFYFGETCLVAFLAHFFGKGWKGILKKLWIVHLTYSCATLVLNGSGWVSIPKSLFLYQMLLGASIVIVLGQIYAYTRTGNREARIVMAGTLALCTLGSLDLFDSLLFGKWDLPTLNYLGLFYLILSLVYVLLQRSMQIKTKLHNSEKLSVVGQLAAGIAHEIRTPVTVLGGFIQLLQKETKHKDKFDIMKSELDRVNRIVDEFLLLAKPSEPQFQRNRIESILEETQVLLQNTAAEKGIVFEYSVDNPLPAVVCDAGQLKQVFINLLKNAIESMDHPGRILMELRAVGSKQVMVRFSDEGCGITRDHIDKIGEPFYTTKEGGTGLGMMVCKRIISEHGGIIRIRSQENEGTTFELLLPVQPT